MKLPYLVEFHLRWECAAEAWAIYREESHEPGIFRFAFHTPDSVEHVIAYYQQFNLPVTIHPSAPCPRKSRPSSSARQGLC